MFFKKIELKISELIPIQNLTWNKNHSKLFEKDYDSDIGPIIVDCDNKIIDGNHRFFILSEKKTGDYKIKVVKLSIKRKTFFIFVFVLSPILLPIGIFNLIKKL